MTTMKKVVGASCGQVTFQNFETLLAPSISAASYNSSGTFDKATRYSSMLLDPSAAQNPINMIAGLAQWWSDSHAGGSSPVAARAGRLNITMARPSRTN